MANVYPAWAPLKSAPFENGNVTVNQGAVFSWPSSASNDYYVKLANQDAPTGFWLAKVRLNNVVFQWRSPPSDPTDPDPISVTTLYAERQVNANSLGGDNDNTRWDVFLDTAANGVELWLKWAGTGARSGIIQRLPVILP
ncbi:hypothetical protein [Herbaspirillum sp.]|uniref:hypothetical protein n=1 Tax=Herbaspirillum sp. TaxID=1890675 RepID=UPI000C113A48|nr:hypothetical protein [Herbaspirillum sp.]MBO18902.1 hypothetical protein [Herbaspirillum sp.]